MTMIGLSDAIEHLREELSQTHDMGKGKDVQFDLENIELELEVVAETDISGEAGVKWYLFNAGVKSTIKDANKHKLKLTLKAVDKNGDPLKVSNNNVDRPK